MDGIYEKITECRFCDSTDLINIWSFGKTPLANSYIAKADLSKPEHLVPLDVCRCRKCNLVQLRETVSPDLLFKNYLYVSSTSPSFVEHFKNYASTLVERFQLPKNSLVIEIGSNDGILLKPFKSLGMKVLGVEPAEQIAEKTNQEGIETLNHFFSDELAETILKTKGTAKIIAANNVFAHMPNVKGIVSGVKKLLSPDGVFVFEVQYLKSLLEKNLFDVVYHEHLFYYHIYPLINYFDNLGMRVFDVELVPVHGGSIRVFVSDKKSNHKVTERLGSMLRDESEAGLNSDMPYVEFKNRIDQNRVNLKKMLEDLKSKGKRKVGYGAPAKATTLLYAFGIGGETLDYIVDDDKKFKQGRFMPGSHIPIVPPEMLYEDKPDYCLILAWNFAEPILKKHEEFTKQGGKFIIPVPFPKII